MAQAWVATDFGGPEVLRLIDVDVPEPGTGEVTIEVRAVGMNPTDYKQIARVGDRSKLPMRLGHEVSGVLRATGPDTEIASGGGAVGDPVLAFRVPGGYATELTVPARDVFAKPANLEFPEAANLLLVGTTAADMLRLVDPPHGSTILVHGASGSVGVSLLQQARLRGLRVIGTASERNFDRVREFGGEPVAYGEGLEDRVRRAAPDGIAASYDTVGTDEAIEVSLAVTPDRDRIVTIAAFERGKQEGIHVTGGGRPDSKAFRDSVRADLVRLAAEGKLVVPMSRTFPFEDAPAALELLREETFGPVAPIVPVDSLEEAIAHFNRYSPRFIASLISEDASEHERFFATVDAPFTGNGFTRWVDGQYALHRPELGLSNWQFGRLFGRGGILSGDSVFTIRTRAAQQDPTIRR